MFQDRYLTYNGLNQKANQLGHFLISQGVLPADRVCVGLSSSDDLYIAMLAVFKIGATYVPINPNHPSHRIEYILSDCKARLYLSKEQEQGQVRTICQYFEIKEGSLKVIFDNYSKNNIKNLFPNNIPCYIIYTSGTMGVPKGVLVSQGNLLNLVYWYHHFFSITPQDKAMQFSSSTFDAFFCETWPFLTKGAELYIVDEETRLSPDLLLFFIEERAITFCDLPTAIALHLFQNAWPSGSKLKTLKIGGEKLTKCPRHILHFNVWNTYGPTEATVESSCYLFSKAGQSLNELDALRMPMIGKSLSNVRIYILDKYCSPLPIGISGELCIGGSGVAPGYLNKPDLTAERFIPNPFSDKPGERLYRTGDLCRYLADGNIEYIGRIDSQVKIRGFRIELGEIEACLARHPAVQQAVVVVRENSPNFKQLAAYWVPQANVGDQDAKTLATELRTYLKAELPDYMVPTFYIVLDSFPLTSSGKIDRKALPASSGFQVITEYEAPETEAEKTLAKIWKEIFHLDKVSREDNFFSLGGDSILSMVMVHKCREAEIYLTPKDVMKYQTLHQLARAPHGYSITNAEQGFLTGELPLTPIQIDFFQAEWKNIHHRNSYAFLSVQENWGREALNNILNYLLIHHDALRMRYLHRQGRWKQYYSDDAKVDLACYDLSDLDHTHKEKNIVHYANKIQNSLNIIEGPIFRAAWFKMDIFGSSRLLLLSHHLIMDAYSWSILIEDLNHLYLQYKEGKSLSLPSKTSSYRQRAKQLVEYANREEILNEAPYWIALSKKTRLTIPFKAIEKNQDSVIALRDVTHKLSFQDTHLLLEILPRIFEASLNEILLTILTLSFQEWSNQTGILLEILSNGREQIVNDMDFSRTVGWFNFSYPCYLEVIETVSDYKSAVQSIKNQFQSVSNHGIGFGLLKYLSTHSEISSKLEKLDPFFISFNYISHIMENVLNEAHFSSAEESAGDAILPIDFLDVKGVEIVLEVINGRLEICWGYSNLQDKAIQDWVSVFMKILYDMLKQTGAV